MLRSKASLQFLLGLHAALLVAVAPIRAASFTDPIVLLNSDSTVLLSGDRASQETDRAQWLASRAGQTWVLDPRWSNDPTHSGILQFEHGSLQSREETVVKDTPTGSVELTRRSWPDFEDESRIRAWPLPTRFGVTSKQIRNRLTLVPFGTNRIWLIDRESRQIWRLIDGTWQGPQAVGEQVESAAAHPDGGLILNTPSHEQYVFARTDLLGLVVSRFGERKRARFAPQDSIMNTWVLTMAANGDIVAAQKYGGLLRRYDSTGRLLWERLPDAPILHLFERARLLAEAALSIDPVDFADLITEGPDGSLWIHFGGRSSLDRFDSAGNWLETVFVDQTGGDEARDGSWHPAGVLISDQNLLSVEPEGLIAYWRVSTTIFEGFVTDENGTPVLAATVGVIGEEQMITKITTNVQGRFVLRPDSANDVVRLIVRADGFQETTVEGPLKDLLSVPIVLEAALVQCIRVVDERTLEPVPDYRAALIKNPMSTTSVSRTEGLPVDVVDTDGEACLEARWSPPWVVQIDAPGYATGELRLQEWQRQPVEIQLQEGSGLAVIITDDANKPISEVELSLLTPEQASASALAIADFQASQTDDAGRAEWSAVAEGTYTIRATHPGYLLAEWQVEVTAGANEETFTLKSGAKVFFSVTTGSGHPIPEARVGLDPKGGVRLSRSLKCVTNEAGQCQVHAVPVAQYKAYVVAASYVGSIRNVAVDPGELEEELLVELRRGVRLTGSLLGTEQFGDTRFELSIFAPGARTIRAPVALDGTFVVNQVPAGKVTIKVRDRDSPLQFAMKVIELSEDDAETDVLLELPAALLISGSIRGEEGPCMGCTIRWQQMTADLSRATRSSSADARGWYELRLPSAGVFAVDIESAEGTLLLSDEVEVRASRSVDFEISASKLSGQVLTAYGDPAIKAQVQVFFGSLARETHRSVTDYEGRYRLTGLPRGEIRLTVSLDGAAVSKAFHWDGTEDDLDLVLQGPRVMRLRLTDGETDQPLAGASVLVVGADGSVSRFARIRANEEGVIEVPAIESGPFTVVIEARGYGLKNLSGIEAGERPIPVSMHASVRSFTVEVRESSGEPCALELLGANRHPIALYGKYPPGPVPFTNSMGLLHGFEEGDYSLVLHFCDGQSASRPLHLAVGSSPHVVF
jgi:hypothetical protein